MKIYAGLWDLVGKIYWFSDGGSNTEDLTTTL